MIVFMADKLHLNPADDDPKLLAQIVDFYRAALKTNAEALAYLKSRGIVHEEVIDRFRIGFVDRSLGPNFGIKRTHRGMAIRMRLGQLGILRDSGHEHFRGCVVFPVPAGDGTGRIVDLYGRKSCEHVIRARRRVLG